ncbi:DUF3159 domain-containing protein [Bifidobacterium tsurumiense]|uniref:ABC-type Mn2 /Zn2 transport system, permease component n=1 Tax=Bifidobacterium tsurumiense TaxID=356829 RepID=A0A087EDB2_9BIFI|nr:DUF3159 domain-containing protein [Bifidobacterium tsurumiense]KFJ05763.1 ABC-type Mn2 /Zn2 transport system, permease component [Bifidobacterium tsurumiense]MDY4677674.1 DUF3159 domain-containing protein [Bifidobacterium tsurumiense]MSS12916.1 DUF3159 domain-containing protein [Bifidobacterium tsurumiense]
MTKTPRQRTGIAALASADGDEDFSVIDAIGGPRGVVESMLPGLVFVVLFVATSDLVLTVIVSAVLAVVQVLLRLVQRQSVMGAISGLFSVAICLIWAWTSHEARNYYMVGFITNAVWTVLLLASLPVRVPGVGLIVEYIRSTPMDHFRQWLDDWRNDKGLYRAYVRVSLLWIAVFSLRLVVQVPLYLSNQVALLGTTRLLMGLPFWALAIWVSYLLVADPMRRHIAQKSAESDEQGNGREPHDGVDRTAVDSSLIAA